MMVQATDATGETEFYKDIEPGVRDIVRLLRDNGINTTSSCEHERYIQFDLVGLAYEIETIHGLLYNAGLRGYSIETIFGQPPDGFPYHRGTIHLERWS